MSTSLSKEIKEIQSGILEGYIPYQERPNSLIILPPPSAEGSTAKKRDEEMAEKFMASTDAALSTYVKLHANENFLVDLEAAKKEIAELRNASY